MVIRFSVRSNSPFGIVNPLFTLLFPVAFLLCFPACAAPQMSATPPSVEDLSKVPTEELISKLQEISQPSIGTHPTAWTTAFIAIDDQPAFRGGILGSAKPATSPVMQELVRRGTASLPQLIAHLSDKKPTKQVIRPMMGNWFEEEYDPRSNDPSKWPANVQCTRIGFHSTKERPSFSDPYTVKVGDLCFVAIGQIVNRHLSAMRYQPSLCLVVNSPVQTPALADAVKSDWSGLTPEEHRKSLEQDVVDTKFDRSPEALKRLLFYYPDIGTPLAVRLLGRSIYEGFSVGRFLEKLLPEADPRIQDKCLATFRKEYGEAYYAGVERELIQWANIPASETFPDSIKQRTFAQSLLSRLFPGVNPSEPPFIDAAEIGELQDILDAVATFHSAAIDQAVYALLKRAASEHPGYAEDQFARCKLTYTALTHLTPADQRKDLADAYRSIMAKFPPGKDEHDDERLAAFAQRFQHFLEEKIQTLKFE
jgi:hypothetical protein